MFHPSHAVRCAHSHAAGLRPQAHLEPVARVLRSPLTAGGVAGGIDAGVAALHAPAGAADSMQNHKDASMLFG